MQKIFCRIGLVIVSLLISTSAFAAQATLSWTDNSNNEDGFRVERRDAPSGVFSQVGSTIANVVTYIDATVVVGGNYCYQVKAFNVAGASSPSNEACTGVIPPPPPTIPNAPSNLNTIVAQ